MAVDRRVFELVAVGEQAVVARLLASLAGARGVVEIVASHRVEVAAGERCSGDLRQRIGFEEEAA